MTQAQTKWASISGKGLHTHFCGAYWFNGFHEDGVRSGLRVCQALGHKIDIKDEVDPSHLPTGDSAHTPFLYKDLPIKVDKKAKTLSKRQVKTASTNQELLEYIERLQSEAADTTKASAVKRGLFGRRKPH